MVGEQSVVVVMVVNVDEKLRGSCTLADYQLQEVSVVPRNYRAPPLSVTDIFTMSAISQPQDTKRRGLLSLFNRKAKSGLHQPFLTLRHRFRRAWPRGYLGAGDYPSCVCPGLGLLTPTPCPALPCPAPQPSSSPAQPSPASSPAPAQPSPAQPRPAPL
ncbi:putative serine/arginine repetitive matrix protein 2-like 1 [Homarus americanus]|uniref:Putative serine/arginine repetitive matrix protein 2-like 1 n=1 Tax=Homarus americanus TaxID=6706 RepID=A0A8J5JWM4_HOMAM|nr:putative serine/arginine repetitive matrix protein 2-like 1 [Homarus americanus]